MCRGRKRGLAGIVAKPRPLAKTGQERRRGAEASNYLMGRTFLDIDMQRAGRPAWQWSAAGRTHHEICSGGQFLGLWPGIKPPSR